MGSNFDFKNFENDTGGEERSLVDYPLARQQSVYTLTFDELQNTMGGSLGKDFGSMNMDELLKSIWSAEETQTLGVGLNGGVQGGDESGGCLQRQGSLTLPRTLSHMTVDEVWKDMSREFAITKDGSGVGGPSMTRRQQTLGELTLEEFLVRAGVVREGTQLHQNDSSGLIGDLSHVENNSGLSFAFHQAAGNTELMGCTLAENSSPIAMMSPNLPLNVNGVRSTKQQLVSAHNQQQGQHQHQHQQKQQPIFPKQPTFAFGAQMAIPSSGGLDSPRVAIGSPTVSSDGIGKSNGDLSSVSPIPYIFHSGLRGRKSSTLERTVERRQRRMIKNRESAARSRARKQNLSSTLRIGGAKAASTVEYGAAKLNVPLQALVLTFREREKKKKAYTSELEAEVAKLKEQNEELMKKRAELLEMQKKQVLEMMSNQPAPKRRSLKRTLTGPW